MYSQSAQQPSVPPARRRRGARTVVAFAAAAFVALSLFPASPAQAFEPAEELNPAHKIGELTLKLKEGATGSTRLPFETATTEVGCPAGFQDKGVTYWDFGKGSERWLISVSNRKVPGGGLDGKPLAMKPFWLHSRDLTGTNESRFGPDRKVMVIVTCEAYPYSATNFRYFSALFHFSKDGVITILPPESAKLAPTTTAVTVSGVGPDYATITATVAPAAATGTVQFTSNGANVGGPLPITGGTVTTNIPGLTPGTEYTLGAKYSGDTKHEPSEGTIRATTTAPPVTPVTETTQLTVIVPTQTTTAASGLTLTVVPKTTTLSGPTTREQGALWKATGTLGNVTVNDDRRATDKKPWTLSGTSTPFASGQQQIPILSFGWTPTKVSGAGTPGKAIPPGSSNADGRARVLATGEGTTTPNVTTTVNADLALEVAAGIPAGNYTSTLTLTLI